MNCSLFVCVYRESNREGATDRYIFFPANLLPDGIRFGVWYKQPYRLAVNEWKALESEHLFIPLEANAAHLVDTKSGIENPVRLESTVGKAFAYKVK
jgi:hypothetical protein